MLVVTPTPSLKRLKVSKGASGATFDCVSTSKKEPSCVLKLHSDGSEVHAGLFTVTLGVWIKDGIGLHSPSVVLKYVPDPQLGPEDEPPPPPPELPPPPIALPPVTIRVLVMELNTYGVVVPWSVTSAL